MYIIHIEIAQTDMFIIIYTCLQDGHPIKFIYKNILLENYPPGICISEPIVKDNLQYPKGPCLP